MNWSILAQASEQSPKLDWTDFAAAIPIAAVIALVIWNGRKKARTRSAPGAVSRPSPKPQPTSASLVVQATGARRGDKPDPLDLIDGRYFLKCILVLKHIPPPGPAFLNCFLHAAPFDWDEEWAEAKRAITGADYVTGSLAKLETLLDNLATGGAPLPVIEAAEEAVTVNLTALAVVQAQRILTGSPHLRASLTSDRTDPFPGWHDDSAVDQVAWLLREECSAIDVALFAGGAFSERPGDCVRAIVSAMETVEAQLAGYSPEGVVRLVEIPAGSAEATEALARRMVFALDFAKEFIGRPA